MSVKENSTAQQWLMGGTLALCNSVPSVLLPGLESRLREQRPGLASRPKRLIHNGTFERRDARDAGDAISRVFLRSPGFFRACSVTAIGKLNRTRLATAFDRPFWDYAIRYPGKTGTGLETHPWNTVARRLR